MEPVKKSKYRFGVIRLLFMGLIVTGVIFTLVMIGARMVKPEPAPVAVGGQPPDFRLTAFSGEEIDTRDLRGKVVLINYWASWCSTCDDEMEMLETAWQHYQSVNPEDVIFLGVAYMDTEPAAEAFLAEYGVTYPNGLDLQGKISGIFQVTNVPETYVLDGEGRLQAVKIGPFLTVDQIYDMVELALAE